MEMEVDPREEEMEVNGGGVGSVSYVWGVVGELGVGVMGCNM